MSKNEEANKAVVRRYIEMWNTGDDSIADEVLAPGYIDYAHPEVVGLASVKQALAATRKAFPDFHISIEFMIGEGDMVALRGTIRRTQQSSLLISHVLWFARLMQGQMVEWWTGTEREG
ncbi:ester cyclase [Ktedonospora formicarum]|uniref:SnoaL-like domain-containing protein n=1 Tax=Ktedonospora formicarum TaxID=2778364 RepID=A0A8J3MX05_9CHLR|nr:ester cyclase [Ktedonospora formicarum]GHO48095.1 hypothetical protein KSX_62580 [Ktedonospora formicarum]